MNPFAPKKKLGLLAAAKAAASASAETPKRGVLPRSQARSQRIVYLAKVEKARLKTGVTDSDGRQPTNTKQVTKQVMFPALGGGNGSPDRKKKLSRF